MLRVCVLNPAHTSHDSRHAVHKHQAVNSKNYTQCDSLLIGKDCSANTYPYVEAQNSDTTIEHEASTSKIAEEQLFYLLQRGIGMEEAVALMVNGFCKEVFNKLPLDFASEADRLLNLKLDKMAL